MKLKTIKRVAGASLLLLAMVGVAYAADQDIGAIANKVTGSFEGLAKLITAGAYVAGMGFAVGAVLKFKAHKDNPTQIPVGTPIAMLFIAAALIFLPSIFKTLARRSSEITPTLVAYKVSRTLMVTNVSTSACFSARRLGHVHQTEGGSRLPAF